LASLEEVAKDRLITTDWFKVFSDDLAANTPELADDSPTISLEIGRMSPGDVRVVPSSSGEVFYVVRFADVKQPDQELREQFVRMTSGPGGLGQLAIIQRIADQEAYLTHQQAMQQIVDELQVQTLRPLRGA